jgi:hypothetical protein
LADESLDLAVAVGLAFVPVGAQASAFVRMGYEVEARG